MKAWLSHLSLDLTVSPSSPEELARAELSSALPETVFRLDNDPSLGEIIYESRIVLGYLYICLNGANIIFRQVCILCCLNVTSCHLDILYLLQERCG